MKINPIFLIILFYACTIIPRNLQWKTAISFYENICTYNPSYRVLNNLGMAYSDKGLNQNAFNFYSKAIDLDPKNPVAYHNLGNLYRSVGNNDMAIKLFRKCLALDPNFKWSTNALKELNAL